MQTEQDLVGMCLALCETQASLSAAERKLIKSSGAARVAPAAVASVRQAIVKGGDPLGEAFSSLRSAAERRTTGAVYTPQAIVRSMMRWISSQGTPVRIVDPGAGSGRFIMAAGATFPLAQLVAVEMDCRGVAAPQLLSAIHPTCDITT